MEVGKGPCSHHIHKELTGVSHGHAEGLSAGGQFRGHGGQVAARRGSRGPHGRRRWGHHQHGGAVERGHPGGAVARVRVMAAQAAGQRVVAAVAVLAGGRTRALAGRPLPRPPQAAAGRVVRLAAAAARLRVPGLRVLLLPPVAAATVGATAPAACRGQAGTGWGTLRACRGSLGLAWGSLHDPRRLTFTVLTAGAAPAIAVPQLGEAWVRVVGVRGRRVLVRESHGPRGSPWVRQRGQRVLVGGAAGAIMIVEGEVGHVCGGEGRASELGLSHAFAPAVSREMPSLGPVGAFGKIVTAVAVSHQNGRRDRPEISHSFRPPLSPSRGGGEGDPAEPAPEKTVPRKALSHHFRCSVPNPSFSSFLCGLEEGAKLLLGNRRPPPTLFPYGKGRVGNMGGRNTRQPPATAYLHFLRYSASTSSHANVTTP